MCILALRVILIPALHSLTDLIALIVESPEFAWVSKSTIDEIVEKVSSQFSSLFSILTHFFFPAQGEESTNRPTRRVAIADARGSGGDFFFTYYERTIQ